METFLYNSILIIYLMLPEMTIEDLERVEKTQKLLETIVKSSNKYEKSFFERTKQDEIKIKNYVFNELNNIGIVSNNSYLIELLGYTEDTMPKLNELQQSILLGFRQHNMKEIASDIEFDLNRYQRADADNLKSFQILLYEHLINNKEIPQEDLLIDAFSKFEKQTKYSVDEILKSYLDTKYNAANVFNHIRVHLSALGGLIRPNYFQRFFNVNPRKEVNKLLSALPTQIEVDNCKSNINKHNEKIRGQLNERYEIPYLLSAG